MDVIVYKINEDGIKQSECNANDLVKAETVNFEGWICGIGLESIEIKSDGSIYRGTCRVGGLIGHIDEDFELPNDYVVCNKKSCTCVADLKSERFLNNDSKKSTIDLIHKNNKKNKNKF